MLILEFTLLCGRSSNSICNMFSTLKSGVQVIQSMTHSNNIQTPSLPTLRILLKAYQFNGYPDGGVFWIHKVMRHCIHSLPVITITFFTNIALIVVLNHIHPVTNGISQQHWQGQLITTSSIRSLQLIAIAINIKIFLRFCLSATCTPGIFESQTQLLIMHHTAQIWYSQNLVHGSPAILSMSEVTLSF